MTTAESAGSSPPWYAAYPTPRAEAAGISHENLLAMIQNTAPDFVLVDLRRNDHEGGTIRGSINLPAQSLWPTIPTLYKVFKAAGVRKVIWYCGSSRGRGTRAASWFADYVAEQKDEDTQSLVLLEGIKGWAKAGREYVQWMDEYEEAVWREI